MGLGQGQVAIACLGAMLYTGLGLFGAARVWTSRFLANTKERSPHLVILSGVMNIISVVVLLAQIATKSAGGVFPCGITSTVSHFYVLLCVLPLALRKSEDSAIWARKTVPATNAARLLSTGSPLLATAGPRYHYNVSETSIGPTHPSVYHQDGPGEGVDEDSDSGSTRSRSLPAAHLLRAKLAATALVVLVGAVTALSTWAGGGSWSIRGWEMI